MEERGVLKAYRPIINWAKLELLFLKVLPRIDTAQPKLKETIIAYLSATPELIYVVHSVGSPGEIDIEIVASSYAGLFDYVERVKKKFPGVIQSFRTIILPIATRSTTFLRCVSRVVKGRLLSKLLGRNLSGLPLLI